MSLSDADRNKYFEIFEKIESTTNQILLSGNYGNHLKKEETKESFKEEKGKSPERSKIQKQPTTLKEGKKKELKGSRKQSTMKLSSVKQRMSSTSIEDDLKKMKFQKNSHFKNSMLALP